MPCFDWYQATFHDVSHNDIISLLVDGRHQVSPGLDLVSTRPGRAKNGYERACEIVRGDNVVAEIWWGGNPGVHVKATGYNAREVVPVLRSPLWEHKITRVDACEDFIMPGLFDNLADALLKFADDNPRISVNQMGDWHRKKARTLYLGSRSSAGQIVLYEKGQHPDNPDASHDWVRLECRAYPKKDAGYVVSSWTPEQTMSATKWMHKALKFCAYDAIAPGAIGTQRKPDDFERSKMALVAQYWRVLEKWAERCEGYAQLGPAIEAAISEHLNPPDTNADHQDSGELLRRDGLV